MKRFLVLLVLPLLFFACSQVQLDQEEIEIGVIGGFTGNFSIFGKYAREGLELAREEINARGGINGKKVRLVYEDVQVDPKSSVTAFQKLINVNKIKLVIGSTFSTTTSPLIPFANKSEILLFSPNQGLDGLVTDEGFYCQIFPTIDSQMKVLAKFIKDEIGNRLGISYTNSHFGLNHRDDLKKHFEALGGEVVGMFTYTSVEDADFRTVLTKMKPLNPDAILMATSSTAVGLFAKQAKELGIQARIMGSFGTETLDFLEAAGDAAEGVIYPYFYDQDSDLENITKFRERFKERYKEENSMFEASAYDTLNILVGAMEQCDNPEDTACVKEKIRSISDFQGAAGEVSFLDSCSADKEIFIKTVKDGKFVIYR